MRRVVLITIVLALAGSAGAIPAAGGATVDRIALEVPYLPQTEALCGGAAVAMVFRYWGDHHAAVQQFAPLVDARAGGIDSAVLTRAVQDRGFQALALQGSIDLLRAQLRLGHPLILLLADRPARYHYVVAVGAADDRVWLHDPTWGPSRAYSTADLARRWASSQFWTLLILPRQPPGDRLQPLQSRREPEAVQGAAGVCDRALADTVAEIRTRGLDAAGALLGALRERCPNQSGPISELAGVRFSQRRFDEAAALATEATARDARDGYAWDVLGSSLFLKDDPGAALRAWNRIGRPQIDSVAIKGLNRTRYALVTGVLGLTPNALLDEESYRLAERRLQLLPDRGAARIGYRPQPDGFAIVDVAVAERPRRPTGAFAWAAAAAHALIDREAVAPIPGWSGQGEVWTARWRWWEKRPRVGLSFSAPRGGSWPGLWVVDGFRETQTYTTGLNGQRRETQIHAGVGVTNWLNSKTRYDFSAGLDSWDLRGKAAAAGGTIERRLLGDHLSAAASFRSWFPFSGGSGFQSASLHGALRSSTARRGIVHLLEVHAAEVSASAPLSLWPGAGEGRGRDILLRAHPLLHDGSVGGPAFGRRIVALNVESQRWLERPTRAQVGLAVFADVANAAGRLDAAVGRALQADAGAGLRVRVPGQEGTLRIDYALGLRDGRQAVTVGWFSDRWTVR